MSNITQIPINSINVLNPRSRNKRIFETIIANIGTLGLKKPITVTPRTEATTEKPYDLVCGQGRLEAYQALGHETIPAIIIQTDRHDAYLMSLVENIARRRHTPVELLKEIMTLKQTGLSVEQIGAKLDLDRTYVYAAEHLLEHGELTLLKEVERGHITVSVAMKISTAADQEVQTALREAYTSGELRGAQFLATKRYLAVSVKPSPSFPPARLFDSVEVWTNNSNDQGAGEAGRGPTGWRLNMTRAD